MVVKLDLERLARPLSVGLLAATCALATAQTEFAVQQAAIVKQPTFKVQTVGPTGAKSGAKDSLGVQLEIVSSDRDQSVRELLGNKGFVVDQRSIAAVRKLNPAVRPDGTVPAGTKVAYYTPTLAAGQVAPGEKTAFDMALAAKYQVGTERATARDLKQQTVKLPSAAYERNADIATHRRLVTSIEATAALVESRADTLTAKDLALSKYYLKQANAQAQRLSGLTNAKSVRTTGVAELKLSVQPLDGMRIMMNTSGSPFEYRAITVKVSASAGAAPAEPLRVYTLPGGFLDRPGTFTQSDIRSLLIALSFEKLTSPSRSRVAQGDMRIWVGPDHAYDAMAERVFQGGPIRFTAVLPSAANDPERELQFVSPTDVVRP